MALTSWSRTALAWGTSLSAFLLALTFFGFLPELLSLLGIALVLFTLSTVLIFESFKEEAERRGVPVKQVFREMSPGNAVSLFLAIAGYIIGALIAFDIALPPEIKGVAGLLILIQGTLVLIERYR